MASDDATRARSDRAAWRATGGLGLVVLLIALAIAFFAAGGGRLLSFETIARHHHAVIEWYDANRLWASFGFLAAYTLVVAASLPGAMWLTIFAGYLFGPYWGAVLAVLGATIGACLVFLAVRHLFGPWVRARAGARLQRLEAGFRRNALSYLLFMRLLPVVPFWLVNLAPALLGVRLGTFFLGTLVGILPATVIFAWVGNGLSSLIAAGTPPETDILLRAEILLPLAGLALLALSPVAHAAWRRRSFPAGRAEHR